MKKFDTLHEFHRYVRGLKKLERKEDLICSLCQSKDVLDIGCIDHSSDTALRLGDDWLHSRIKRVAHSVTGLDILEKDAAVLNGLGFNIAVGDAENFSLDRKYDVINAGDLIEHLSNIGRFLDCARLHLKPDGVVIITTPNPFNIEQLLSILLHNDIAVNEQHTVWIDPKVMWEMTRRHGFSIIGYFWIDTRFKIFNMPSSSRLARYLVLPVAELLMKMRPLLRRDYCVVLKPVSR